ncbi:unnamed protein product [Ranitomeya imitator]|uniref:Helix-turn-helix domain-containing protein n=1 Tax=Ranitomeya imitator TaxID=111125 RepID=A0ABN9KS77_9NEOB|nr:unnamed protein product [Ranitomeya imitator]
MGAAFASSYANLFLGMWERGLFFTKPVAYIEGVLFWTRYIDDILFIWQGPERDLFEFVKILNDNELNIRLTVKYSQTTIDFLDIQISGMVGKTLETDVFRKKTAANNLLHASSSHPKPLIDSIPTGQFLRARRICSNDVTFKEQANALTARFKDRGYSNRSIKKGYKKAKDASRLSLLQPHNNDKTAAEPIVRFISTYNGKWFQMREALKKYWPILLTDRTLAKCLPQDPAITYRRSPNLKDQLVHSYYRGPQIEKSFTSRGPKWGFYPCGECIACPNMLRATEFKSCDGTSVKFHNCDATLLSVTGIDKLTNAVKYGFNDDCSIHLHEVCRRYEYFYTAPA